MVTNRAHARNEVAEAGCAPLELDEAAVQLGVERGQLVEERAPPLQPRNEEGRQRRVEQDALQGSQPSSAGYQTGHLADSRSLQC